MNTPIKIEVCERMGDWKPVYENGIKIAERHTFHAQIEGEPGYWAAGDTIAEAIGDLINSHREKFGVNVTFLGKQAR